MYDPFLHIEDYIKDELTAADKRKFEAAMSTDKDLAQAVDDFPLLGMIGEALIEQDISNIVNDELYKSQQITTSYSYMRKVIYGILLGLLIVVLMVYLTQSNKGHKENNTPKQLYASLYTEPAWPVNRSDTEDNISKAISEYLNGKSSKSKNTLKSMSTEASEYWLSEIYLSESKYDSTLIYLNTDIGENTEERKQRKLYIQILALYLSGRETEAKKAIDSLPSDMDSYYMDRLSRIR